MTAVLIVRHGVMRQIGDEIMYGSLRKELFDGEPVIKEHIKVMFRSGRRGKSQKSIKMGLRNPERLCFWEEVRI